MEAPLPSRTLYVRNLPEKLPKVRLRRLLHAAFSAHGRVVWIVAERTMKLRGQAFVTFENQGGATAALRALHATDFVGRAMAVTYARALTDRAGSAAFGGPGDETRKKRAARRKERKKAADEAAAAQAAAAEAAAAAAAADAQAAEAEAQAQARAEAAAAAAAIVVPNKILFVEKGGKAGGEVLSEVFARFGGFVEVRAVPGKEDMAFVEFSNEAEAAVAMSGVDGRQVGQPPTAIKVSFAKK